MGIAWTYLAMLWLIALCIYLGVINFATYAAFARDKASAISGGTRISERVLLMLALAGGSIGAIKAQRRLRHKTLKQPFASDLMMIVGLQAGVATSVVSFGIAQALL